jgi:hypothetical protein
MIAHASAPALSAIACRRIPVLPSTRTNRYRSCTRGQNTRTWILSSNQRPGTLRAAMEASIWFTGGVKLT